MQTLCKVVNLGGELMPLCFTSVFNNIAVPWLFPLSRSLIMTLVSHLFQLYSQYSTALVTWNSRLQGRQPPCSLACGSYPCAAQALFYHGIKECNAVPAPHKGHMPSRNPPQGHGGCFCPS